jgi:hypothetical protein
VADRRDDIMTVTHDMAAGHRGRVGAAHGSAALRSWGQTRQSVVSTCKKCRKAKWQHIHIAMHGNQKVQQLHPVHLIHNWTARSNEHAVTFIYCIMVEQHMYAVLRCIHLVDHSILLEVAS